MGHMGERATVAWRRDGQGRKRRRKGRQAARCDTRHAAGKWWRDQRPARCDARQSLWLQERDDRKKRRTCLR